MPVPARAAPAVVFWRPPVRAAPQFRCAPVGAFSYYALDGGKKFHIRRKRCILRRPPPSGTGVPISGFAVRAGCFRCFSVQCGLPLADGQSSGRIPHGFGTTSMGNGTMLPGGTSSIGRFISAPPVSTLPIPPKGRLCSESRMPPLLFGAGRFAPLPAGSPRPAVSPFGVKERKKPRRVPARLFIAYCLSYTLTRLRSLPIRSNRTTPSALANRVSSEPMPTFVPGWI